MTKPPLRRRVKILLKEIQRNPQEESRLIKEFGDDTGIDFLYDGYVRDFLATKIPGRKLTRAGILAKRLGAMLRVDSFLRREAGKPDALLFYRVVPAKQTTVMEGKLVITIDAGNKIVDRRFVSNGKSTMTVGDFILDR